MKTESLATLVLVIVVIALTSGLVNGCTNDQWRDDAVDQGHAEYYLNANYQREWRWKEPHDHE